MVVEFVLGIPTALQLPKGAPACNKFDLKEAISIFELELCSSMTNTYVNVLNTICQSYRMEDEVIQRDAFLLL